MTYRTSVSMTPLLIFDGNCQAHHLAAIFAGSGLADAYCLGEDYGFVPSYRGCGAEYIDRAGALALVKYCKSVGRKTYQITQSTQMSSALEVEYSSFVDKIIKFPFLQQYAIAPGAFERVYKRRLEPPRVLDFDLRLMQLCQEKAESSFDFASYVRENSKSKFLFNTESHPRGYLVSRLFADIARQIEAVEAGDILDVVLNLEDDEGINHVTVHPVSKDLRDALGYDWGATYERYINILKARSLASWGDVIKLIGSEREIWNDTQLLLAAAQAYLSLGAQGGKGTLFRRLTELSPGFVGSWSLRNQYWRTVGNENELLECRIDMRQALRRGRYYSQARAWIEIQNGNYAEALTFARDYLERTPDRADGVVAYAKALSLLGQAEQARATVFMFAKNRGVADIDDVITNLGNLSELNIDHEALRMHVAESAQPN